MYLCDTYPCWSPILEPVSMSPLNMLISRSWALSEVFRVAPMPMLAPNWLMSFLNVPFPL